MPDFTISSTARAMPATHTDSLDVVLIGSGIMSANLGALLKRLDPALKIQVYEAADELAFEASNGWNNAGTGHAGICELSYTPIPKDGSPVKVQKVIDIFQEFEQSLQFWAHAVASGMIDNPKEFINPVQHISFVHGQDQVDFLKSRHAGMSAHHFFAAMEYTTDRAKIGAWAPLLTEGRDPVEPIAATKMDGGTDINFGNVSRKLLTWLVAQHQAKVYGQNLPEAPTMAVPHLDTRILDGKKTLLFGPFAAWTTRFLHRTGSWTDLPRSVKPHNLMTLLKIGATNIPLVRYLVMEVIKTSFPHLLAGEEGKKRIEAIIPTYGTDYRKPEVAARFNELAVN